MTRTIALAAVALVATACAAATDPVAGTKRPDGGARLRGNRNVSAGATLKPYASIQELRRDSAAIAKARRAAREKELAEWRRQCRASSRSTAEWAACDSGDYSLESVTVSASAPGQTITNTQHAGVDEGGIVKRQGDVLVVLRRGRLFTIGIGGAQLDSLDVADADGIAPERTDNSGMWYDELLVWNRTVVVIGFSYERGGTEIGLFDLAASGKLAYRATYHLRSTDYYSFTNYASRLIGSQLILFSSFGVPEDDDPQAWLPALRRWRREGPRNPFEIASPIDRVFRPTRPLGATAFVHTLTRCELAGPELACDATVVLGDPLTQYYASPSAGYVWTTEWNGEGPSRSTLYRVPFDGTPVSAIGVNGTPPDHLAFLEDSGEHVNVVVAQSGDTVSLLRLPLSSFSDGTTEAPAWHYRPLAQGMGGWVTAQFVGPYVLVGSQSFDQDETRRRLVVTNWMGGPNVSLPLAHDAQRIEAIGAHAVVFGSTERSLSMSAIRLGGPPAVAATFVHENAHESEHRSHGFFYRQDTADSGIFGLPITAVDEGSDGRSGIPSARILFVRNHDLAFTVEGALAATPDAPTEDQCRVSCTDWYGDARPIFIGERIFALLGYELVEGRVGRGLDEVQRLMFNPSRVGSSSK